MKRTGFYIIKDKFFEDMSDPYLKGNKAESEKSRRYVEAWHKVYSYTAECDGDIREIEDTGKSQGK